MYLYSFFNFAVRWMWVVNTTLRPLYTRERTVTLGIGSRVRSRVGLDA